jgi:hypothetical protein
MKQPNDLEDPEMKKLLALWERIDQIYWRRTIRILITLAIGIALADIIAVLLTAFYLFVQINY